jgi:hypothetical protein
MPGLASLPVLDLRGISWIAFLKKSLRISPSGLSMRSTFLLRFILSLGFVCLLTSCASLPQEHERSSVIGMVRRDNGAPVRGAWVSLMSKASGSLFIPTSDVTIDKTTTDDRGAFILTGHSQSSDNDLFLVVWGTPIFISSRSGETRVSSTDIETKDIRLDRQNVVQVPNRFVPAKTLGVASQYEEWSKGH